MKVMPDSQSIHRSQCTKPDMLEGKVKGRVFLLIVSKTGSRNQGRWWTDDCTDSHTTQWVSPITKPGPQSNRTEDTCDSQSSHSGCSQHNNGLSKDDETFMSTLCNDWSGVKVGGVWPSVRGLFFWFITLILLLICVWISRCNNMNAFSEWLSNSVHCLYGSWCQDCEMKSTLLLLHMAQTCLKH